MTGRNDDEPVIMVPADLEVEDRIVGPVTFRLAGWLATGAAGVALAALCWPNVPVTVLGGLVALAGVAGGFARPGRRPLAWWTRPVIAYLRRARTRAHAVRRSARPRTAGRPDGAVGSTADRGIRARLRTRTRTSSDQVRPATTDVPAMPAAPPPTAAPAAPAAASAPGPTPDRTPSAKSVPPRAWRSHGADVAGRWPRVRRVLVAAVVLALGVVAGVGGRQLIAGKQPTPAPRGTAAPVSSPSRSGPASPSTPQVVPPFSSWLAPAHPRGPVAADPYGPGGPLWLADPFGYGDLLGGAGGLGGVVGGGTGGTGGLGDPPPAFPWWWAWGGDCGC